MRELCRKARLIICLDVMALWATMCPAFLFIDSNSLSIDLTAVAYLLTIAYTAIRLFSNPLRSTLRHTFQHDKRYWICASFFIACAAASIVSSNAPLITLRYTCLLCGTIVIGLYFGCRYSITALLNLLLLALLPISLLSILLCVTVPDVAIMHAPPFHKLHDERWRGVFTHKNWLGVYMGLLATITIAHIMVQNIKLTNSIAMVLALLAALFLLLKAQSTTALISLTLSFAVILYCLFFHQRAILWGTRAVMLTLPLLSACILDNSLSSNLSPDTSLEKPGFSRDSTLSGRVPHWAHVTEAISSEPWRGHGYETFWHTDDANFIHDRNQWIASQAHSGWLEIMLDLGVVLGTAIILWMVWSLWRVATLAKHNKIFIAPTAVIIYMFSANSTESLLPNHSGLLFTLLIALGTIASRQRSKSGSPINDDCVRTPNHDPKLGSLAR